MLFGGVLVPVALFSLMVALVGRCDSDGSCVPVFNYSLMFPGLLIGSIIATLFVVRWAVKDDY